MYWTQQLLHRGEEIVGNFGWSKTYYAIDGNGDPVPAGSPEATAFCIVGALQRAAFEMGIPAWKTDGSFQMALESLEEAVRLIEGRPVCLTGFNDMSTTTLDKVRTAYALAVDLTTAEAA